jgi:hypothetical protein
MGMGGQSHNSVAIAPKKEPVPIVQEVGWAPGPVCKGAEKSCPPPEFDPRTFQAVASSYID